MAVIANITSLNVSTSEENFSVSNSGWTENTSSAYGTDHFKMRNSSPVSAFPGPVTRGYLNDTVPASKNQTVRLKLFRPFSALTTDQSIYVGARMSAGGDDWIGLGFKASNGTLTTGELFLVKCVNGTRTTLMSSGFGIGTPAVGGTADLELRVSGDAPNISVSAWYNGSQVGATQTVADSALDIVGRVGFFNRVNGAGVTNGIHFTEFYAEDDTGGDTTAPVLSSPTGTATGSTTATVGATTDEANGTMYAFVSTSATPPGDADLKAGTGAVWSGSQAISSTGAKTFSATGLTASTGYYAHLIHTDAAANDSNIVTSAQFTTSAAAENPVITGQPSNATVKRGQTATFTVTATGSGTVTYQWQRNPGGVGSWSDISGATAASYTTPATTISGGSANDQDDYRCQVSDDDAGPVATDVVTLTVQQCVLALNSAGYEFGDGNDIDTLAVLASTELQVAAYPLTEWPPASAVATATATTGSNGRLADLGDDDLSFGTTYRVIARNAADGETWAWTMAAS